MMKKSKSRTSAGFEDFIITVWQNTVGRILLVLACLLLLVAAGIGIGLYLEGTTAGDSAQQMLAQYEEAVNSVGPQVSAAADAEDPTALPVPDSDPEPQTIDGYQVIGTVTLEKTAQTLPVISETSDNALKVSVCWFKGAHPGETGNMVITGHDYASGAHFGQLNRLDVGDRVTFTAPDETYVYEVYDTEIIRPDQPEKLDDYEGETALTLLTCTSHGNRRLVVRCKPVA